MIKEYETIMQWGAIMGIGLAYIASNLYLNQSRRKIISDFKDSVNNSFLPKAEKVQKNVDKLEKLIKKL